MHKFVRLLDKYEEGGEWVDGSGSRAKYGQIQNFRGVGAKIARWVWFKDRIHAFSEFWERCV